MASEVDIYNAALIKLGDENTISALGQDGREGEVGELIYPQIRDRLLMAHPWNFAIKRSTLIKDTTSPAFEFTSQYHLPADFLRGVKLYNSAERWKIEGDRLLTDASPVNFVYIAKITDTGKYPPLFTEALSSIIAAEIAEVITGSSDKAQLLMQSGEAKLREAKRRDGQEGTPDNIEASAFTSSKLGQTWWT